MEKDFKSEDMIIVFFGELSTKGKNIFDFIRLLGKNIKEKLKEFSSLAYEIRKDHIYIKLNGVSYETIEEKLMNISGIHSYARVKAIDKDIESIKKEAIKLVKDSNIKSFKVVCKRADKNYPIHSDDVNKMVGGAILENVEGTYVDVHKPELFVHIYIREDNAYIYGPKTMGMGGYPLGIAGKALHLLSGGIDSPVAAYLMMKRGCKIECIHFAAPPYTSNQVLYKIKDILNELNVFQPSIKLIIVPFTKLQEQIYEYAGTSYAITIMRRMMLRISERIAKHNNDLVISSGESIGQVASQTLKSMVTIDKAINSTIIRPLATYDKTEIISIAQKINTFDISIRPYEDCCTIFKVKDPVTAPHLDKVLEIESKFDYQSLVEECVNNAKSYWINKGKDVDFINVK